MCCGRSAGPGSASCGAACTREWCAGATAALAPARSNASTNGRGSGAADTASMPVQSDTMDSTSSGMSTRAGDVRWNRYDATRPPDGVDTSWCARLTSWPPSAVGYTQPPGERAHSSERLAAPAAAAAHAPPHADAADDSSDSSGATPGPGSTTANVSLDHCTTRPSLRGSACSPRCTTPTLSDRSCSMPRTRLAGDAARPCVAAAGNVAASMESGSGSAADAAAAAAATEEPISLVNDDGPMLAPPAAVDSRRCDAASCNCCCCSCCCCCCCCCC
mmetsp:Transcript_37231/g.109933  ORF Transcript_37231/g.109933 Transcript_37231/m.109933 type:complete len:276 (+) Transcript_37231:1763-2590(+)